MPKSKPANPPPTELLARLHEPMLALHAALETEALWKAALALLRTAAPSHRVTFFLGHLGMGEARVVLTDPPIARPAQWYEERGKANPFTPFIDANRGRKFYRFEEVLPPRTEWLRSDFYRRFAKQEGWDKGISFLFWARREVTAMFSLYRAPGEKTFSAQEEAAAARADAAAARLAAAAAAGADAAGGAATLAHVGLEALPDDAAAELARLREEAAAAAASSFGDVVVLLPLRGPRAPGDAAAAADGRSAAPSASDSAGAAAPRTPSARAPGFRRLRPVAAPLAPPARVAVALRRSA
jgi:hypothetical protein